MPSNNTFRPVLQLMSGRAAAFAVTFFIPVVLSRIFPPAEFGTYKQIFLIVYSFYGIGQIGMAECLYYFLPTHPEHAGRFVANSVAMLTLTGLGCLIVLSFGGHLIPVSNPGIQPYLWIAGAYLLLMLASCALEIVMVARKHFRLATLTYAGSDLARGVLLIAFGLVTHSLMWLLIAGLIFNALRIVAFLAYLRSEFGSELRLDMTRLKQQFVYTVPFALAVVIDVIQQNYHQYAVGWYFDVTTFAIYSVGCLQIPLADFLASPASNVMMVRMGEEIRDDRKAHAVPIWHDTSRKLALVFIPMAALLVVNARHIITILFTERYAASIPIFMLWSLTVLFSIFQTDGVLRVLAQTRFLVVMNLTRLATIIAMMTWAIHHFGLIGPVIVTLAGMLVARMVALARIKSLFELPLTKLMPWTSLAGIGLASMLAAIPSALINYWLKLPSLIVLPISGMVYLAVYSTLLLVCGLLSESEKRVISNALARRVRVA